MLAAVAGSAMAQQSGRKGDARKENANDPAPVRADGRLNRVLAPIRDEHHLPSLVGAILHGGRLVAIGAVGIRKIGSPQPMRVTDEIHIGSCTKAMTATLIGMLVDDGKLPGDRPSARSSRICSGMSTPNTRPWRSISY